MTPFEKANAILADIQAAQPETAEAVEQFRIRYLGTKNELKPLMGEIRHLPNEQKRDYGQLINQLKAAAEAKYAELQQQLAGAQDQAEAEGIDVTAPAVPTPLGSRHPVSIVMNRIVDIFTRIGFDVAENREIEDDWHNFTALNTPEDHPARDMTDTYYLRDTLQWVLRSQTSTAQVRTMEQEQPPIRVISPGRVYRNETVSARSHMQFHQVEGLYIDKGVSFADMKQTLLYFAREMFGPETEIRLRPSYFPFTEPSAEMDVWLGTDTDVNRRLTKGTGWLEVLGCGMVDPAVLTNCGIDPEVYTGFAFGMGIERQALRLYDIPDIRLFFENDVRFLRQFAAAR